MNIINIKEVEMPRNDGTGPMGNGPMTGWGSGFCADVNRPVVGRGRRFMGRGLGCGSGRGMRYGLRSSYSSASMSPQDEISFLKNQTDYIKNEMDSINARIHELESESKK